jgi:hypothetical protein
MTERGGEGDKWGNVWDGDGRDYWQQHGDHQWTFVTKILLNGERRRQVNAYVLVFSVLHVACLD